MMRNLAPISRRWLLLLLAHMGASIFLALLRPVLAEGKADTVYQFYDEEGTLIVTNRPEDLPSGSAARIRVSYHSTPTGRPPIPTVPSTLTILRKAPPPVPPQSLLDEAVRFRYYDVCARTAAEALHRTRVLGPYDSAEGERFSGQTRWSLGWSYDYTFEVHSDVSGGVARVSAEVYDVNIYSDVEVLLPKLSETCSMNSSEREIWQKAMESLKNHEMDHVSLVLHEKASQGMADSIAGAREYVFPVGVNVDSSLRRAIQEDTHAAGIPWVRWIKQINDTYDDETRHGLASENRDNFFRALQ